MSANQSWSDTPRRDFQISKESANALALRLSETGRLEPDPQLSRIAKAISHQQAVELFASLKHCSDEPIENWEMDFRQLFPTIDPSVSPVLPRRIKQISVARRKRGDWRSHIIGLFWILPTLIATTVVIALASLGIVVLTSIVWLGITSWVVWIVISLFAAVIVYGCTKVRTGHPALLAPVVVPALATAVSFKALRKIAMPFRRQIARIGSPVLTDIGNLPEGPKVLYLRNFSQDLAFVGVEEKLARQTANIGYFVALGHPAEILPPCADTFRLYGSESNWQDMVVRLIDEAKLILINITDAGNNTRWELDKVRESNASGKTLVFTLDGDTRMIFNVICNEAELDKRISDYTGNGGLPDQMYRPALSLRLAKIQNAAFLSTALACMLTIPVLAYSSDSVRSIVESTWRSPSHIFGQYWEERDRQRTEQEERRRRVNEEIQSVKRSLGLEE